MAAQAIGRAAVHRDTDSFGVAIGAAVFMLSDSILAIDKFALPLPAAQFWVLWTYYVAQVLIVHNATSPSTSSGRTGDTVRAEPFDAAPKAPVEA
jgi:uncharacterized membrane protein YhhN